MVWQWFWFRYGLEKVVQRAAKGVVKWWKLQGVNTKGLRQISGFCATMAQPKDHWARPLQGEGQVGSGVSAKGGGGTGGGGQGGGLGEK